MNYESHEYRDRSRITVTENGGLEQALRYLQRTHSANRHELRPHEHFTSRAERRRIKHRNAVQRAAKRAKKRMARQ